jgi:hypothetical protein
MLKNTAKLIFSFMLTGWVYAEAVLFFPPVKQLGERFVQVVRIPTHDEWGDIARSDRANRLSADIDRTLVRMGGSGVNTFFYRYIGRFIETERSNGTIQTVKRSTGWSDFGASQYFDIPEVRGGFTPAFPDDLAWF